MNNELRCLISLHPINVAVSLSFGMVNLLAFNGATLALLTRMLPLRVYLLHMLLRRRLWMRRLRIRAIWILRILLYTEK